MEPHGAFEAPCPDLRPEAQVLAVESSDATRPAVMQIGHNPSFSITIPCNSRRIPWVFFHLNSVEFFGSLCPDVEISSPSMSTWFSDDPWFAQTMDCPLHWRRQSKTGLLPRWTHPATAGMFWSCNPSPSGLQPLGPCEKKIFFCSWASLMRPA
ncbi:hypothetical protein ACFX14_005474 [Malus domestica]